ncbi:aromatic ring-hydroxylating oxygenase subunit alpha [Actinomycetospora sp. C-140]
MTVENSVHSGAVAATLSEISESSVPPSLYWDQDLFREEMDLIYRTTWVYVGHESEVATPGSFCRKKVAGQELVMTRDPADQVSVFFNRCSHRGNLVCMQASGESRSLRCAYHGWAFGMDGALRAVPRPDAYGERIGGKRAALGLSRPAETRSYGGFVFCRFEDDPTAPTFDDYVRPIRPAIDRLLSLSPDGRVSLSGGWVGHKLHCNWKMVVESNVDNYHINFVHRSLLEAVPGAFESEEDCSVVDLGMGHTEIDFRRQYRRIGKPLHWSGVTNPAKLGDYVPRMAEKYGAARSEQVLVDGPPHVMVFPNLFLSQMNVMVIDPVGAEESTAFTTPVFLSGAPELNRRTAQQCSAAMGPAGMIVADDAEIGERNQLALHTVAPAALDLSRGLEREVTVEQDGSTSSPHGGDETSLRAIWRTYRALMSRREAAQSGGRP